MKARNTSVRYGHQPVQKILLYPDTLYIDELIAKDTVNTVPPQTLNAFRDHGTVSETIYKDIDSAQRTFSDLEEIGISMKETTQALEDEGVKSFAKSFIDLLDTIEVRRKSTISELGSLQNELINNIEHLKKQSVIERVFDKDPSVWHSKPEDYRRDKAIDWAGLMRLNPVLHISMRLMN